MTQPSDFKAAVASLLNSFADAANALADELVTSLLTDGVVTTSDGAVVPGTVTGTVATFANPVGESVEVPVALLPDGTPAPQPEIVTPVVDPSDMNTNTPEPTPVVTNSPVATVADASGQTVAAPASSVVTTPVTNLEVTDDGTVTPTTADGVAPDEYSDPTIYSTSTPVDTTTTTDVTDPTESTTDLGTNS
jgi:hypothetical protein